jgi:hypothetical protein
LLPLPLVAELLVAELRGGVLAGDGLVVFENVPADAAQGRLLLDVACVRRAVLGLVIELVAGNEVCARRVATRRVCAGCEPDPAADPHRPASADRRGRCAGCGGQLEQRRSDGPWVFRGRLARFHRSIGGLRAVMAAAGVPWRTVDATVGRRRVLTAVFEEIQQLTAGAPPAVPQ